MRGVMEWEGAIERKECLEKLVQRGRERFGAMVDEEVVVRRVGIWKRVVGVVRIGMFGKIVSS